MNIQQVTPPGDAFPAVRTPQAKHDTDAAMAPESRPAPPSAEQVQHAMEQMQRVISLVAQNLQFTIDAGTGQTVIKVVDSQTKEVVRQIPTDEVMSISRALGRMQGLLLIGKA